MQKKFAIFLCAIFAAAVICAKNDSEIRTFIQSLPEEDKVEFLRYAIEQGYYRYAQEDESLKQDVPALFEDVYSYCMKYHPGNLTNVIDVGNVVCFPTGCINLDDSIIYP